MLGVTSRELSYINLSWFASLRTEAQFFHNIILNEFQIEPIFTETNPKLWLSNFFILYQATLICPMLLLLFLND